MADLEPTAQKLLNKDSHNPNSPKKADAPAPRAGLSASKSTLGSGKPSLRETLMAQKKATLAAKNLPARPGSAMAHFSPVRNVSGSSSSSNQTAVAAKPSATRTRPEGTISVNAGGMSVAPMRPARRRPEVAPRPATAGPYSVRDLPSMDADSPEGPKHKSFTPKAKDPTPRRPVQRARPGHASHASEPSVASPSSRPGIKQTKQTASPRVSPAKLKQSQSALPSSSPSRTHEDMTPVAPNVAAFKASVSAPEQPAPVEEAPEPTPESQPAPEAQSSSPLPASPSFPVAEINLDSQPKTPAAAPLKVFEDPFVDDQSTPKPVVTGPVLEDKPVNKDAAVLHKLNGQSGEPDAPESPEKTRQNSRLLDSGITKIKAKILEVHGFRKLQSLLRDNKTVFTDEKFEALLIGLFQFLEDPLVGTAPDKALDVKAQILATIKLLLKKERDNFQPHVTKGLESLLQTRSAYDSRAHIVSGLELLADELVSLGDGPEIVVVLSRRLQNCTDSTTEGCRTLSMGLHVLKEMLERRTEFKPTDSELAQLAALAGRCIDSTDSGVRMDAVQMCVVLHARVGEQIFWDALKGVKDDPKSLITYYIVKRQREQGIAVAA